MKLYQEEEQKRKEEAAALQKAKLLREKQELQAQRANYKEQEWEKVDDKRLDDYLSDEDETTGGGDGEVEESDFYCVVCDKFYKSEHQLSSHESSRKHTRLAWRMKKQMMADEEDFAFTTATKDQQPTNDDTDHGNGDNDLHGNDDNDLSIPEPVTKPKKKNKQKKKMTPHWGFDEVEQDLLANEEEIDHVTALAATLELEQSSRRRKRNGKHATGGKTEGDHDGT
jgi:DnaJ family protein A protein 5